MGNLAETYSGVYSIVSGSAIDLVSGISARGVQYTKILGVNKFPDSNDYWLLFRH